MQSRLQLAADAAALLLSKATFIGLRLLTMYLCAAHVDRTVFGPIALAFTTAEMCRYIGDWGTDTWALRQFAHPEQRPARSCFEWVTRLRIASSCLAVLAALVAIRLLSPGLGVVETMAIALTSGTSLWMNLGVNWLQARGVLRSAMPMFVLFGGACSVVQIVLASRQATPEHLILVQLTFELLLAASVIAAARRHDPGEDVILRPRMAQWFKEATPIALAALLALGYGRIDQYFVSTTASAAVLGDYTLAQRLVEPVLFVAAAMSSTIYARASAFIHAHGRGEETRYFAWRWVRGIALIALVANLAGAAFLSVVVSRWLPQYTGIEPFLLLALGCTFFRCINLALTAFVQASGAFGTMFRISVLNAVVITIGVFSLGNILGPIGAALGVVLGEGLNTCIQCATLRKLLISD